MSLLAADWPVPRASSALIGGQAGNAPPPAGPRHVGETGTGTGTLRAPWGRPGLPPVPARPAGAPAPPTAVPPTPSPSCASPHGARSPQPRSGDSGNP